MKLENHFKVPLPPSEAWGLLLDIERIAPCLPGASITEFVDDKTYKGQVALRLGPVALNFNGTATFVEIDADQHHARITAQGADNKGRGGANAAVQFRIEPDGDGSRVLIDTDLNLSGSIAQYGRGAGIIQATAEQLVGEFSDNLRRLLDQAPEPAEAGAAAPATPEATPISGFRLMLRVMRNALARLFGLGREFDGERIMKLVSFRHGGRDGFGVVKDDGVIDLTAALFFETRYASLREVLAAGAVEELRKAAADSAPSLGLTDISFLPPIPRPSKIICVGQNYYADAAAKAAGKRAQYPNVFGRSRDSLVPHGEAIVKPDVSEQFDYEGELGVVIGRQGRHIAESEALSHVAGYTCLNEGSVRDWQEHGRQNFPGKNFHRSGSIGPWMITADEVPDPTRLAITTRVNGEQRQHGGVDLLVFEIPFLISYISQFARLEPGDIISTGSPGNTAREMDPPGWLKPGDRLEVEISGIGSLKNPIEAE